MLNRTSDMDRGYNGHYLNQPLQHDQGSTWDAHGAVHIGPYATPPAHFMPQHQHQLSGGVPSPQLRGQDQQRGPPQQPNPHQRHDFHRQQQAPQQQARKQHANQIQSQLLHGNKRGSAQRPGYQQQQQQQRGSHLQTGHAHQAHGPAAHMSGPSGHDQGQRQGRKQDQYGQQQQQQQPPQQQQQEPTGMTRQLSGNKRGHDEISHAKSQPTSRQSSLTQQLERQTSGSTTGRFSAGVLRDMKQEGVPAAAPSRAAATATASRSQTPGPARLGLSPLSPPFVPGGGASAGGTGSANTAPEKYGSPSLMWALQRDESPAGPLYTTLTRNIVDTVEALTPDDSETRARAVLVGQVAAAVRSALPEHPHLQVLPFGSSVSGLSTRGGDVDLVVTGVIVPSNKEQGFYDKHERPAVARVLDRIVRSLRQSHGLDIRKALIIRHSRIPLAKLEVALTPGALPRERGAGAGIVGVGLAADVSVATDSGPRAAAYVADKVQHYRALRPLVLVVKAYLKVCDLNDVASGGLASYGATFMVLAHLMEEERCRSDIEDVGLMLHRFFKRFSPRSGSSSSSREGFDCAREIVAVASGGVVTRASQGSRFYTNLDRVCCVCPLSGRDVTQGCYRSGEVLAALGRAARYLDAMSAQHAQGCPTDLDILGGLVEHAAGPDADDEASEDAEDDRFARGGAGRRFDGDAMRRRDDGSGDHLVLSWDW